MRHITKRIVSCAVATALSLFMLVGIFPTSILAEELPSLDPSAATQPDVPQEETPSPVAPGEGAGSSNSSAGGSSEATPPQQDGSLPGTPPETPPAEDETESSAGSAPPVYPPKDTAEEDAAQNNTAKDENTDPNQRAVEDSPEVQAGAIIAFTGDELRNYILSGNYDLIYLGADIEMPPGGIQINAPTTLVIDGNGRTITEGSFNGAINVAPGAKGAHITLRNAVVNGSSFNGLITTTSGTVPDATLVIENVTYNGPQLAFFQTSGSGKTIVRNSSVIIVSRPGGYAAREMWRGTWLELEGKVTIYSSASVASRLFNSAGAGAARPEYNNTVRGIVVRAGARVEITSTGQLFQTAGSINNALVLEDDAYFSANSLGFMMSGQYASYFSMGERAQFLLAQAQNQSTPAFNVQGQFIMQPGSVFRVTKNSSQHITSYIYGRVTLNSPGLFLVQSLGTALQTDGARNWNVSGINAINYTKTNNSSYIWNMQDDTLSPFGFTATSGGVTPTTAISTVTGLALNATNFNLTSARSIAIGNYTGGITATAEKTATEIAGTTQPNAQLAAMYYPDGIASAADFTVAGQADAGGAYSMPIPSGKGMQNATENSDLYLKATSADGTLAVERLYKITDGAGVITFGVTGELDFGGQPIPTADDTILNRPTPMQIFISHTGTKAHNWQLMAAETQALTGPTTVPGAFVFVMGDARIHLNEKDQPIATFNKPAGQPNWSQQLNFGPDEGLLLSVSPGDVMIGDYTGTITWTLVDAPGSE